MVGTGDTERRSAEKADRRASRELIANYHQSQLRALLEHVRDGFTRLDAGDVDEFELDDLIHRYKRSATELWKSVARAEVNGSRLPLSRTCVSRATSPTGGRAAPLVELAATQDSVDRLLMINTMLPNHLFSKHRLTWKDR